MQIEFKKGADGKELNKLDVPTLTILHNGSKYRFSVNHRGELQLNKAGHHTNDTILIQPKADNAIIIK